ncbi:hypothetical protein Prum_088880 [Phytohabitans rumicis]|uniref:Uncharacterized protein n=1 Tax=Phytohabitans rumicis TaxID=1076125 RepID=A0A6V8LM47_9ACTN|nr:hypothetical protein Prum_088880 [Phytohabitans rumicis]
MKAGTSMAIQRAAMTHFATLPLGKDIAFRIVSRIGVPPVAVSPRRAIQAAGV